MANQGQRSRPAIVATALAVIIAATTLVAPPAAAGPVEDEQQFVVLVNQYRAGRGVAPLAVHGELVATAQSWTQSMAERGQLTHAPDISAGITAPWTKLGENVGVHGVNNVPELFDAFINSPAHVANIVDPSFTHVGVGVVYDAAGKMWTTHRFMALATTVSTTTSPPTTAPPTTAPPTTISMTTSPPTTTAPAPAPTTTPTTTPTGTVDVTAPNSSPADGAGDSREEAPVEALTFQDTLDSDLIAEVLRDLLLTLAPVNGGADRPLPGLDEELGDAGSQDG